MLRRLLDDRCLSLIGAVCCSALLVAATSESPVADAAMSRNRDAVRSLLSEAADVNAAQSDGMTALHWAAMNGDVPTAQVLLSAGAHVSAATRLGALTPLELAAENGHAAMVKVLLDAGASATTTDAYGTTALMLASGAGTTDAVTALIDHRADVNAIESSKGATALMFAAAHGRTDVVRILLAHGADWKPATQVLDWTALPKEDPRMQAMEESSRVGGGLQVSASGGRAGGAGAAEPTAPPIDESTREYPRLVGKQGGLTALMFAARQGYIDTAKALVDAGADVNEIDPGDRFSPLMVAAVNGQFDTAMYLLSKGANPNLAEDNGATPLYAVLNCVWAAHTEYPQPQAYTQQKTPYLTLLTALLDHGADPNPRLTRKVWYSGYNRDKSGLDETGATPFWRAAYSDDVDAMKLLVAHGADPNVPSVKLAGRRGGAEGGGAKDKSGLPSVPTGGPGVPPLLAASGEAYGSSFTSGEHVTAPTGMLAAVTYLVEVMHADVNVRDADGNTALHNAAARGDNEMVKYLVSKGADVTAVNRRGQTTADMANGPYQRIQPFPDTIALLQKLGAKIMGQCVSC